MVLPNERLSILLSNLRIRTADNSDSERILALVSTVLDEFGLEAAPQTTDSDLLNIEESYLKPGGTFDVLENSEGAIVGTVGLYPITATVCELRKMYFVPQLRGVGLGKYVLQYILDRARELGFHRVVLETSSKLEAANHLYARFGFQPIVLEHPAARADRAFALDL